ncbi:MAG: hypothetical protein R3343_03080 [Nitriliruptorales bacterium]|nr:hypothetical protein [Nitriliruptorales bacterium]
MHIVLVSGPDPGHALPVLGLAAALRRRGHDVTVATGRDHRPACERADVRFLELPLLAPTPHDEDVGFRLWGRAAQMTPPFVERLSQLTPIAGVVTDTLTRTGAFAAELLGVPWIELSPHHLMEPSDHLPPIGLGRTPDPPWWRRYDDARLRRRQRESIAAGEEEARAARRELGLPAASEPPLARLLATVPALEYPRPDWPDDAHIVGSLAADPPWSPLRLPAGRDPLVVVTDTTASGSYPSIAALTVDALGDLPLRVVATTDEQVSSRPGVVVGRGPHGPLLDEADLAVGPGGHGFVTKALVRGVPLMLVPLAGDQRETAARVRWAGVGRSLSRGWLQVAAAARRTIRWEVLRVLGDPGYAEAARRAAQESSGLGPDHAAGLVVSLLAEERSPSAGG